MYRDTVIYIAGDRNYDTNELGFVRTQMMSFSRRECSGQSEPHLSSHPYLALLYFDKGNGSLEIGGKEYAIRTHDMVVINRFAPYRLCSEIDNIPLCGYLVMIQNFRILNNEVDTVAGDGFICYSFRSPDNEVYHTLTGINRELSERQYSYHTKMTALFTVLVADIIRLLISISDYTDASASPFLEQMEQAKALLEQHYRDPAFDLVGVAHSLGLIKRELLNRFKDAFHKSAVRYLDGLRLDSAKRLLAAGKTDLDAIAAQSGFENSGQLKRTYQRLTGTMLKSRLDYESGHTVSQESQEG